MKLIKLINLKSNKTISLREIFLLASAFLIIPTNNHLKLFYLIITKKYLLTTWHYKWWCAKVTFH